jgi:type VI protein secretion system component VasK
VNGDTGSDTSEESKMDFTELLGHWQTHHDSLRQMIHDHFERLHGDVATLKEIVMALQVDVQNLVDQVARNTSLEESSALAMAGLSAKITDQNTQIANLAAQIAAGQTISPADIATLQASSASLVQSAKDLSAAVPQSTGTQPVQVAPVPPATPAAPSAGAGAQPQGARRF